MADEEQTQPNIDAATSNDEATDHNTRQNFRRREALEATGITVAIIDVPAIFAVLGVAASISSITQVVLIIADMHSRNARKITSPRRSRRGEWSICLLSMHYTI